MKTKWKKQKRKTQNKKATVTEKNQMGEILSKD